MSPPQLRINTFMKADVDPISKIFIKIEALCGFNRLPMIQDLNCVKRSLMIAYNIMLVIMIITLTTITVPYRKVQVAILYLLEYTFCMVFSCLTRKRLVCYFNKINRFDAMVGCKPRTSEFLKRNFILHAIFVIVALTIVIAAYANKKTVLQILTVRMTHYIELYFYGHLFCLISPRLELINFHMEASLSNKYETSNELKRFRYYSTKTLKKNNWEIDGLMEMYQIVISAFDCLINAIKWQFLVMLSISFMSTLVVTYENALIFLGKDEMPVWRIIAFVSVLVGNTSALFAPCIYCDQLHVEVRRLRTLLASRLYENKMDKSKRSVARAMLALTEEHDLSLSLLGMLKIDISLPLKFLSLLLTYLIILLQFQKVIGV